MEKKSYHNVAIMHPYLFPYLGYFQLINSVDTFVFLKDVTYAKKTWINRNQLLVNQHPFIFTIPLHKASQNRNINEHFIKTGWAEELQKTLILNYIKSQYFDENFDLISDLLYDCEGNNLSLAAEKIIRIISEVLNISCEFRYSTDFFVGNKTRHDRIIEICRCLKATTYVNPIGGKEIGLYKQEDFNPIKLRFIQREDDWGNLSIIHYLLVKGRKETKKILEKYKLIR